MLSITRNDVEGYWLNIFCSLELLFLLKDYFSPVSLFCMGYCLYEESLLYVKYSFSNPYIAP